MKFKSYVSARALIGRMSPAERTAGRYLRSPDGHMDNVKSFQDLTRLFGDHTEAVASALKQLSEKAALNTEHLAEIEQKIARNSAFAGGTSEGLSLGAKFVAQDGVKEFAERNQSNDRFAFETKATITSSTANAAGSVGAAREPFRDPEITPLVRRKPAVRDLLTVIPMTGGSVEVVKVLGRNNNAAPVAEAAAKPQSDIQFGLETVNARVIAHWMKASRQILDDLPQLQGTIDTELLDGLALKEDDQLLNGDNSGQNLQGLIPFSTAFSPPVTLSYTATMIDRIALAMLQNALAEFPVTGIILHPSDWQRIMMTKDAVGNYILGAPGSSVPQRLWGVPVVTTQAVTVDKFLVGDFTRASTLYDRWRARVELGTVDDDFTKNLVTILAEERLAHAVKQPKALTYGDFGNVS